MLYNLLLSMRPKQWYKNALIFVGIIFSNNALNFHLWPKIILAFICFCMISGSEYILNDLIDRKSDIQHPDKKNRPIVAGKLNSKFALSIAIVFIIIALSVAYFAVNLNFTLIALSYVILFILYSILFKKLIIIDVFIIAVGFVIRAIAGCLAIDVSVSYWLIICTFTLAVFLVFEKRWNELKVLQDSAALHRRTLSDYSVRLLELFIIIISSVTITSYLMYCAYFNNYAMFFTAILAIYGIFRFLYLVHIKGVSPNRGLSSCEINPA